MPTDDTLPTSGTGLGPIPKPTPKPMRLLALLVGVVLGVSALPGLWLTLMAGESVLWFSTLFELLVMGAAAICVLAGLGRFKEAWALALTCAAGTVLVTAVFAFVEVRANFGQDPRVARFIMPAAAFRVGLAGLIALVASATVWTRDKRSIGALIRAGLVTLPIAIVGIWLAAGPTDIIFTPRESPLGEGVRLILIVVGALIGIGLISAAGHLLIRAYEFGRPDSESPAEPSKA